MNIDQQALNLYNKGTLLLHSGKAERAAKLLKASLKIDPTIDGYLNLGTAYKFLDKDNFSISAFKEATKDHTDLKTAGSIHGMAWNNLGLMMYLLGDDTSAESYYGKALKVWKEESGKENFYDCKWNLATCVLRQVMSGEFDRWSEGWDLYENRFLKSKAVSVHPVFGTIADRVWNGQRDCRVLLAQEQGLGDTIMFARFIPQLEEQYGIKCDLQVNHPLGSVLEKNGVSCPVEIDTRDYDYMLPLGSICRFVNYIDRAPYISWPDSLDLGSSGLNIGLVFSGSSTHNNDRHRSCPPGFFKFLSGYGKVWSLNPGAKNLPNWIHRLELPDWQATCSALNSMNFVVTVDTSLAHMSGAMGVPTFMLQPRKETDFRWGAAGCSTEISTENLWYDSLKVIHNPNDWSKCIDNLKKELLNENE